MVAEEEDTVRQKTHLINSQPMEIHPHNQDRRHEPHPQQDVGHHYRQPSMPGREVRGDDGS